MSDVSAIVLTIGEETTQRAIESLKNQTLQPKDIIVIENVKPSYKAGNLGVSKVRTDFFTVVAADMILDKDCLKDLRKCMTKNVGIVIGHLRDPLVGRNVGIYLYRKKCFEKGKFTNSISTDTDFRNFASNNGWSTVYPLRFHGKSKKLWHTFGKHRPDYTPLYTFSKFKLEGRRYIYRKRLRGILSMFRKLKNSKHEMAVIAQVAMCHGLFMKQKSDMLKPFNEGTDFNFIVEFLKSSDDYVIDKSSIQGFLSSDPLKIYKSCYKLGIKLRKANSFPAFKFCLDELDKGEERISSLAKIALCHGLFSKYYSEKTVRKDYGLVMELMHE